jgi:hypothetical protein
MVIIRDTPAALFAAALSRILIKQEDGWRERGPAEERL